MAESHTTARCPIKVGQIIAGRYSVRGFLGSGSMGWVLKVADEALDGELVALKVIFPHLVRDAQSMGRFRREVSLARQLVHPNIVHVHDFEENADAETFLAMQYVRGIDLAELLAERRGQGLPADEALFVLCRVAEALSYAHEQGIVHRDLKPGNVLIGDDGTVRLCDFGLATSFESELGLTRTGESVGTPLYMSPEQFRSETVDQRVDIYAFGMLAYELVSGYPPFQDDDFFRLAERHLSEAIPPLDAQGKRLPEWFGEMVERCCAKNRADRPWTFTDFLPDLRRAVAGGGLDGISARPGKRHRTDPLRSLWFRWYFLQVFVALGSFIWVYHEYEPRVFIMNQILQWESYFGYELPGRRLLLLNVSLLHPESAFNAIEDHDKFQLAAILHAHRESKESDDNSLPDLKNEKDGLTLLQHAVMTGDGEMVGLFGHHYADTTVLDPQGETVLTSTLRAHDIRNFRRLLYIEKVDVNAKNAAGDTPLHVAVAMHDEQNIHELLRASANPSIRNKAGLTPLHLAVQLHMMELLEPFGASGSELDVRDREGRTLLMYSVMTPTDFPNSGMLPRSLFALSSVFRTTIDARDNSGRTALITAIEYRNGPAAHELIARGADPTIRDAQGREPLDLARDAGLTELADEIEKAKAKRISDPTSVPAPIAGRVEQRLAKELQAP